MGDFNPSTPTLIGSEWAPNGQAPLVVLDNPQKCVVMRVRPGAQTVTALHVFLQAVVGNPGLCVEIVDALAPAPPAGSPQVCYPGSDASSVQAGWQDEAAGSPLLAAKLGSASRFGLAHYGTNTSAAVGPALPMSFRGGASLPASSRVISTLRQGITAWLTIAGYPNYSPYIAMTADLTIAGTRYKSGAIPLSASVLGTSDLQVANWFVNPATNLPFTQADINQLINGTDSFGMGFAAGSLNATALRIASIYLSVGYCAENRHGQFYALNTAPQVGWNKQQLQRATSADGTTNNSTAASSASGAFTNADIGCSITDSQGHIPAGTTISAVGSSTAITLSQASVGGATTTDVFTIWKGTKSGLLAANTWYWVVVSCPSANPANYATVPVFGYGTGLPAAATGAAAGEQRQYAAAGLQILAGPVAPTQTGAAPTTVEYQAIPLLLDAAGTILSQSQPYAACPLWVINNAPHDNQTPQLALVNPGQQVTTPGGGPFTIAGLLVYASFEGGAALAPDRPLVFSIRSGGGAITGGGTLLGTCTIDPSRASNGVFYGIVPMDGGTAVSAASSTQYHVIVSSQATPGRGWVVAIGDTRSDVATPGGSTVNAVEKASIGPAAGDGQTDAAFNNGAALTRYDMGIAFIQGPTAPASPTATVLAGSS